MRTLFIGSSLTSMQINLILNMYVPKLQPQNLQYVFALTEKYSIFKQAVKKKIKNKWNINIMLTVSRPLEKAVL